MRSRHLILALTAAAPVMGAFLAAAPVHATFPGANGRIAFSTDIGPNPQIFTVNPNGTGETQITNASQGHAFAPEWSPDGTKIAFEGDITGHHQIYIMNADGSGRKQLTNTPFDHFNPRFSPDGRKIAFALAAQTAEIFVMNIDGTGLMRLTSTVWNAFDPEWSPDGTSIAFDSNKDGLISAIWVMNADGSDQHRLTAPALEAFYPDWSPDGTHILFSNNCCIAHSNVYVINPDGSGLKQITHVPADRNAGFASYSPNGAKIVFANLGNCALPCDDLYTMNANGTDVVRIVADHPAVFLSDWGSLPS
jgi:Tol biopolymer transport system component